MSGAERPWRVLVAPSPAPALAMGAVTAALERADASHALAQRTVIAVEEPAAMAAEIRSALACGERVLLANGQPLRGAVLGDPLLTRAVAALPADLPPGVVVGAFHHAHALTELALRAPAVRTYVAPPLAELLGADDAGPLAAAALCGIDALGEEDDGLLERPRRAHVGYARMLGGHGRSALPPARELAPQALRDGEARGPLLGGGLLSLALRVGRWPAAALDGAILAIEPAGAQLRMLDRYLQRLRLLGVLDRIGALLVAAPFELVQETPALELRDVVRRAVAHARCATAIDAFVGCGVPGTRMRLTAPASVRVEQGRLTLAPLPDPTPAVAAPR